MTDKMAALDDEMGDGDDAILHDHVMALFYSNGSLLTHHIDRADGFTDPLLKTCRFVVFPECEAEADCL